MQKDWFKWERESTVHPIFLTLESAILPLEKYFGEGWPETILLFKGDVVLWCNRMQELFLLGQKMIDFYLVEENREKMLSDLKREEGKLVKVFEKISSANIGKLSDEELLAIYNQFREQHIEWFKIGWLVEPVGLQGEQIILGKTTDKRLVAALTSTTRESFNKRELSELLGIAEQARQGRQIDKLLEAHAKKYFWLHNSYFKTTVLGKEFFKKEIEALLGQHPEPKKYLEELQEFRKKTAELQQQAIEELKLGEKERKLIELIDLFGWFQDYRKEFIMQANHFLDVLLAEIGKRAKISAWEMKYSLPQDLKPILEGSFDKAEFGERKKAFAVVWKPKAEKPEFFSGGKAAEKEQGLFPLTRESGEIVEIRGMVACPGKAEGVARVTMSPREAGQIKEGEILVTSMTSPDFIVGIKRAKAIVTNEGGITCHAAIVSREFGIPCIVGTRIATKSIKTGDFIEVNANHGFVRKIKRKPG